VRGTASRSDVGRAVWCLAQDLVRFTSKAGMSFSFMGIMLATARSIKDSDLAFWLQRPRYWSRITRGSNADLPILPRPRADYSGVFKPASAPRREGAWEQVPVRASRTVWGQPATLIRNRFTPPRLVVKLIPECLRKQKGNENMIELSRIGFPSAKVSPLGEQQTSAGALPPLQSRNAACRVSRRSSRLRRSGL
jgi:hypothetical protein